MSFSRSQMCPPNLAEGATWPMDDASLAKARQLCDEFLQAVFQVKLHLVARSWAAAAMMYANLVPAAQFGLLPPLGYKTK